MKKKQQCDTLRKHTNCLGIFGWAKIRSVSSSASIRPPANKSAVRFRKCNNIVLSINCRVVVSYFLTTQKRKIKVSDRILMMIVIKFEQTPEPPVNEFMRQHGTNRFVKSHWNVFMAVETVQCWNKFDCLMRQKKFTDLFFDCKKIDCIILIWNPGIKALMITKHNYWNEDLVTKQKICINQVKFVSFEE